MGQALLERGSRRNCVTRCRFHVPEGFRSLRPARLRHSPPSPLQRRPIVVGGRRAERLADRLGEVRVVRVGRERRQHTGIRAACRGARLDGAGTDSRCIASSTPRASGIASRRAAGRRRSSQSLTSNSTKACMAALPSPPSVSTAHMAASAPSRCPVVTGSVSCPWTITLSGSSNSCQRAQKRETPSA